MNLNKKNIKYLINNNQIAEKKLKWWKVIHKPISENGRRVREIAKGSRIHKRRMKDELDLFLEDICKSHYDL